ncbi:MAG TPA: hypothetical protein VK612_06855 [Pyrinomonadaceae bacterium]|nr:hypothetical protein [Pyrinomonadaceae bacterium]
MPCNWELFEMRVIVYIDKPRSPAEFSGEGLFFMNVFPDLRSLGIADFKGQNDVCDFRSVFSQLVELKTIPFTCRNKDNSSSVFARMQLAERENENLMGARLYVHRRDRSEFISIESGIAVTMDDVKVGFTANNNGSFYVHLFGNKAKGENF